MKSLYNCIRETFGKPEIIKPGLNNFGSKLAVLSKDIPVDELIDIFGETYRDQPRKPDSWLRCTSSITNDDAQWAQVRGYLCYDNMGDYVSFINKPSNDKLSKASKYIENQWKKLLGADKKLWDKYDAKISVIVEPYNRYYQPKNTYGIGVYVNFK